MRTAMNSRLIALLSAAVISAFACASSAAPSGDPLTACNVVWDSPSRDSSGSMPIGNGDIGLNVWIEEHGDLLFYIGKSDAWSENAQLLKLGRVRVSLEPNPFAGVGTFRQELRLREGEITVAAGEGRGRTIVRVWVDANRPVVWVEVESGVPVELRVRYETWRTERRRMEGGELFAAYGVTGDPNPVYVEPDTILPASKGRITWYHHNAYSCYPANLTLQGLGGLVGRFSDPIAGRTFGGCIEGPGLRAADAVTLISERPSLKQYAAVTILTAEAASVAEWKARLDRPAGAARALTPEKCRPAHRAWWNAFWDRSWIRVSGAPDAMTVTRGYALQNWIAACAGRGAQPIKFNGSLFTVDAVLKDARYNADYRSWGGPYWFQNTRLPYYAMIAAGQYDLMRPLFGMYTGALPLARERTRLYYRHEGAFFPETMYFWGTYVDDNYGRDRASLPTGLTENRYIRYLWEGGIELTLMMLDVYDHTRDAGFLRTTLMPLATEIVLFYDLHYPRDGGRIRFEPAQALETWWDSVNPMPEIAGLRSVLPRLLELPKDAVSSETHARWTRLLGELPPVPVREDSGAVVLAPAEKLGPKSNSENPELYAIFPYGLYGVGKDNLDLALRTWERRDPRGTGGWRQDAVNAAMLGLGDEAGRMVAENFSNKHEGSRFPAFWGPNYDWIPDQDHGSVAVLALQRMLMQTEGRAIRLLPAWPDGWDADFKLHAPYKTVVEGSIRGGRIASLTVTPPERRKDVILPNSR